ncbi:MAG: flippase-like domain-containing protein [Chloroflexi bacterium]|nr:flippase-like domain-containing protein [Chloroflexota bacterium]
MPPAAEIAAGPASVQTESVLGGQSSAMPAEAQPSRILRGLLWSGLAGLVAAIAVGVWGDWNHLAAVFGRFSWVAVPVALALTLVNYTLRFGKWQYYVHRIGARPTLRDSALIFIAGFALAVTPGKTGEFLKAYLLHRRCGTPAWKAAPITLADRATDGFAVLILAGVGLTVLWRSPWPVLLTLAITAGGCAVLALLGAAAAPARAEGTGNTGGTRWMVRAPSTLGARAPAWAQRLLERPVAARTLVKLRESGEGASAMLDPKSLALAVGIGVVSWSAESVALWIVLAAFGLPATSALLGGALVALNAGTLAGAISLLPGGAGAAEATIAAVLVQQMDKEIAAAATLLIRLCTLWFGATLGVVALVLLGVHGGDAAMQRTFE